MTLQFGRVLAVMLVAFAALNGVALAACGEGKTPTWSDVDTIRYERTGCIGRCPGYEVLLSRFGFYYVGRRYVEMPGTYRAPYSAAIFSEAVQQLRLHAFYAISIDMNAPFATDTTDLIIAVERCGVTTKFEWAWYQAGRKDIPLLFDALDGITKSIPWRKKSDSLESPDT